MVVGGGSQRLLSLNPITVFVVLLLGVWSLLGFDNSLHRKIKDCLWNSSVFLLFHCCSLNFFPSPIPFFYELSPSVKPFLLMAFLSYDNMCNVDRLKFLQEGIPVLEKFANVWSPMVS